MGAITSSRAENLPIGELSKRSGVNIETIRYYERVKILAPPPRTDSGRRVYHSTDLRILVFIGRSRELLQITDPKGAAASAGSGIPNGASAGRSVYVVTFTRTQAVLTWAISRASRRALFCANRRRTPCARF